MLNGAFNSFKMLENELRALGYIRWAPEEREGFIMSDLIEIKCLPENEVKKILTDIEARVAAKIKEGLLTEREVREIEEMKLHPLPDMQDVQSVYDSHLFKKKAE